MTSKKRDQRQYDPIQQYLSGLILNTILGIVQELGIRSVKPSLDGMAATMSRRRRGWGLPCVCGPARKLALELRPAWRRATARRDLRAFSRRVPYSRIRPALAVPYFSAASCPRRVCRNPPSIFGLFWILPPALTHDPLIEHSAKRFCWKTW